jgi:hypothetical protein
MKAKTVAIGGVASLLGLHLCVATQTARAADPTTPVELVDALNGVFGKYPGTRSGHAKGFCLTGQFTPAPDAAKLSKAPAFRQTRADHGAVLDGRRQPASAGQRQGQFAWIGRPLRPR